MKIVFLRSKVSNAVISSRDVPSTQEASDSLDQNTANRTAKESSSSKHIIKELQKRGLAADCEEWKFWTGPNLLTTNNDHMALRLLTYQDHALDTGTSDFIRSAQPDIIWVEGRDFPPYVRQILKLCGNSFKMIYTKHWRPWKSSNLQNYDLCLVDEQWQADKVRALFPGVECGVWDKLINYETAFYPLSSEKTFDICYVAYLRRRKNHELLFRAMAKLADLNPTCVCVGEDRRGYKREIEQLATELKITVSFAGEVSLDHVNTLINRSRMGVICSELDAAPRALLEYMAADVPVLVNSNLHAGTRYVGTKGGLVSQPQAFHLRMATMLEDTGRFSPRAHILAHYASEQVIGKFCKILNQAGFKVGDSVSETSLYHQAG